VAAADIRRDATAALWWWCDATPTAAVVATGAGAVLVGKHKRRGCLQLLLITQNATLGISVIDIPHVSIPLEAVKTKINHNKLFTKPL
jgi:hypothetical protein